MTDTFAPDVTGVAMTCNVLLKQPRTGGKRLKYSCLTVFLSDIHLGTAESKADEVVEFLKHIRCRKLVLNGDIIDGCALRRGGRWRSSHSRVIRKLLKMTEHDGSELIYLRGNHDDILERLLPLAFGRLQFLKEHRLRQRRLHDGASLGGPQILDNRPVSWSPGGASGRKTDPQAPNIACRLGLARKSARLRGLSYSSRASLR